MTNTLAKTGESNYLANYSIVKNSETYNEMIKATHPYANKLVKYYQEFNYYTISFDVQNDMQKCIKIATKFSDNTNYFGKNVVEIQFDEYCYSLSIDMWVNCNVIGNLNVDTKIQYYIHTKNNLPISIFFRIPKKRNTNYEEKMEYFIRELLEEKIKDSEKKNEIKDNIMNNNTDNNSNNDTLNKIVEMDSTETDTEELEQKDINKSHSSGKIMLELDENYISYDTNNNINHNFNYYI